jgi:hypothetical protein
MPQSIASNSINYIRRIYILALNNRHYIDLGKGLEETPHKPAVQALFLGIFF